MKKQFVIVTWPQVSELMKLEGFNKNSHIVNDEFLELGVVEAYFVYEPWLLQNTKKKFDWKKGVHTDVITISDDLELWVKFGYTPEENEVWTYSNGDPGHPGSPEEFDFHSICVNHPDGDDISELIMELNLWDWIEEKIKENNSEDY